MGLHGDGAPRNLAERVKHLVDARPVVLALSAAGRPLAEEIAAALGVHVSTAHNWRG